MDEQESTKHESSSDTSDPRRLVRTKHRRQKTEKKDDLPKGKDPILPFTLSEEIHTVTLAETPGTE